MSNGTPAPVAWSATHVMGVGAGVVLGGMVLAPLMVAALPLAGLGALTAAVVPGAGALVGGYLGHLFTKPA